MTAIPLLGVDLSSHQGRVNMRSIVAQAGMRFIILKATEGADFLDPKVEKHWRDLLELDPVRESGPTLALRGLYHFARPDNRKGRRGGEKEARWFCKNAKKMGRYEGGCLPPALDWEKWTEMDPETRKSNLEWIRGFIEVVRSELGREPMIYTGVNVWRATTGDSDEFVDYPLWHVKYRKAGAHPPRMPKTAGRKRWNWTLWQFSGGGRFNYHGKVEGVPSGVADVNRFNGDIDDLLKLGKASGAAIRERFTAVPSIV